MASAAHAPGASRTVGVVGNKILTVRSARPEDRERIVALTVAAFATDAQLRWLFPDDELYATMAPLFFDTMVDLRLRGGHVDVNDSVDGAAQWNPPGGIDVPDAEQARAWANYQEMESDATSDRMKAFEAAFADHVPSDPHWYLGVVAVDPDLQGQGIGRAVVAAGCARADADHVSCFLESTSAKNLPLYESLGFQVTGAVDLRGGPRVWFMTRPPRARERRAVVGMARQEAP